MGSPEPKSRVILGTARQVSPTMKSLRCRIIDSYLFRVLDGLCIRTQDRAIFAALDIGPEMIETNKFELVWGHFHVEEQGWNNAVDTSAARNNISL